MLRLTYKGDTNIPIEAECIRPCGLAGKSVVEIARLAVQHGNVQAALGDFFDVAGDADDLQVRVEGDCAKVKWIGASMTAGRIDVVGDAGMHLGSEMNGGVIEVTGNAGDWVGAEMAGGLVHIRGNVGNLAGGGYRGGRIGMRGGAILVQGDAGHEVGCSMRRGLIAVGGTVGEFVGASMIAGTILLFSQTDMRMGAGMRRGTIVAFNAPPPLPTFRYDCIYSPDFLQLYFRYLQNRGFPVPHERPGLFHRYSGDMVALGKGELLIAV